MVGPVKFAYRADPPAEPQRVIQDQNSSQGNKVYYITSTHDKDNLLLHNVWARRQAENSDHESWRSCIDFGDLKEAQNFKFGLTKKNEIRLIEASGHDCYQDKIKD